MEFKTPSWRAVFSYASIATPLAALYFPVYIFLADFYAQDFGLSLAELGIAFLLIRLFDAVSDPIIGYLTDRCSTRFGGRKFWLILGAPLVIVSVWLLFVPNSLGSHDIYYFSAMLLCLTIGWTIMLTPYYALGAELSDDYSGRARITLIREAFSLVGTLIAALLYSIGDTASDGFYNIAIFIVLGLPSSVGLCFYIVKERKILFVGTTFERMSLSIIFRVFKSEPMFGRLLLAYFLNGAANGLPAALFLFYVNHKLKEPELAGVLILVYFFCAIISTPLWIYLSKRYAKHRIWCWSMLYASTVFLGAFFLQSGDWHLFLIICILSGFALSSDLALPAAIQADLVDIETLRSGQVRTGILFAIWSVATKGAVALSSGFALLILHAFDFEATSTSNSFASILVLAALYSVAPVILKLLSIFLMWSFPLDRKKHLLLREKLEERKLAI